MFDNDAALAILDALQIPVIVKDECLRFVFINQAASAYFQAPAHSLTGKTDFDCFPAEHASVYWSIDERVLATGQGVENEELIIGPDGKPQIIITCKTLVSAGATKYLVAYFRDITAHRQSEEQLRQAQKMEAVGQLTGGIAHDFNNHLGGIIGSLGLMQRRLSQGRTDDLERYTENAMASAQRAASLTHRLLAFSRQQSLNPRPVDVKALLVGLESLIGRTLGSAHHFRVRAPDRLWPTFCDHHQLENALLNLAINARDAMPQGGVLTAELDNCTEVPGIATGDYLRIRLSDTGQGIPAALLDRVVEPFFTTKPAGKGTGLGLSMVYGFTKQSAGHLLIDSEEGKGTTVSLYLPRYLGNVAAEHDRPREQGQAAARQRTILLVEDDAIIRQVLAEGLDELGYRVQSAGNGRQGLQLLASLKAVDLLLTDIGLPDLNGRDLAARALAMRPALRVLFVTGYDKRVKSSGGLPGNDPSVLTKPFTVADVDARIQRLLGSA